MTASNESDHGELEPDALRGARPVLRGRGAGDSTPLPGNTHTQDDPLYTVPRYTTAQVAEMLGLERVTIQSAIHRGRLASALMSPRVRLISQAAIDAYRANHLGQVGQPTRKRQQMLNKMAEAQARKAAIADADGASEAPTGTEKTHE